MKKLFSLIAIIIMIFTFDKVHAQCTIDTVFLSSDTAGVYPAASALPPITQYVPYDQTVQGKIESSFDTTLVEISFTVQVDSIRIDSILGRPAGINYTKNPNVLHGGGYGCVEFAGTTASPAGTYPLTAYGTAWIHIDNDILGIDSPYTYVGDLNQYSPFGGYYLVVDSGMLNCSITFSNNVTPITCAGLANGAITVIPANGTSPYHYAWNNGDTTQSLSGLNAGSYYLTVTDAAGCIKSDTVVIQPGAVLNDSVILGGPASFCSGDSVTLSAPAGYIYNWSNGSTNQSITVSTNGNYDVTVTTGNNCSAVSTPVAVTVSNPPSAVIDTNGPITFCNGGSVTLSAQADNTYHWSNGSSTSGIVVSTGGSYSVTVTNANNCSAVSMPLTITVNPNPQASITAGSSTTFCEGDSVILSAPAGSGLSYLWSDNETTGSISVLTGGSYTVQVTDSNNCSALSTPKTIIVEPTTIIISQPAPQLTCAGSSVTFSVSATGLNLNYQWQLDSGIISGANDSVYNIASVSAGDTGSYRVVVTGTCGTQTSNPAGLSLTSSLQISQQPQSQIVCVGLPASFTFVVIGGNAKYQWKKGPADIPGDTLSTFNIDSATLADAANYSCAVTSGCGDTTSAVVSLTVNSPSSYTYGQTICTGSNYSFNGQFLNSSGTYLETLTNINGCDSLVTLHLTVTPPLINPISAGFCPNGSYNFDGIIIDTPGVYYDTLSTATGCDSVILLTLSFSIDRTGLQDTICPGESYPFNGHNYSSSGSYIDTLTSTAGCDSIVTLYLSVDSLPTPIISRSNDTLQTQIFATYQWLLNDSVIMGATQQSIVVMKNGNYSVAVTNAASCSDTSSVLNVTGLGIADITSGYGIKLYPNPNTGNFTLQFADDVVRVIEITDAIGRVIIPFTKIKRQENFNFSELSTGVYYVVIKNETDRLAQKLVIAR